MVKYYWIKIKFFVTFLAEIIFCYDELSYLKNCLCIGIFLFNSKRWLRTISMGFQQ